MLVLRSMPAVLIIMACVFESSSAQQLNASFIRTVLPNSVLTDEIFGAEIHMRNNGQKGWNIENTLLHSQNPYKNTVWGTYFILQHHGSEVAPGDSFIFSSNLRAPSTPGMARFSFQCYSKDSDSLFGEIVVDSIMVIARTQQPPPPRALEDVSLDSTDFEYLGSFKLPTVSGYENTFVGTGITLKHGADGAAHLLLNTGTYEQMLYEVTIPPLHRVVDKDYSSIPTASLVRTWGRVKWDTDVLGENIRANGGFWFDEHSAILYWTHWNSYYSGPRFPILCASQLHDDGTVSNLKYWYLPGSIKLWKAYWQGVTNIPHSFAQSFTGGRTLSLGFGGCYSIIQTASRGPSIGALRLPALDKDTLDVLEVLRYDHYANEAADRDGNFFLANTDIWGYKPSAPWDGKFTYNSFCRSGVFIDLPDKKGYVAFVRHCTGRIGYDWGGLIVDPHYEDNWYFYNLDELGDAALGKRSPGSIQPSSIWKVSWPYPVSATETLHTISGACFDSTTRTMYVYMNFGLDKLPVVHAYRVKPGDNQEAIQDVHHAMRTDAGHLSVRLFGGMARIRYTHFQQGALQKGVIEIYDSQGRLIDRLKGSDVLWNTRGKASGVYVFRACFGEAEMQKTICLY